MDKEKAMRIRSCTFCVMMLLLFVSMAWARNKLESNIDDQVAVEVTVYNSNLGLIKDIRRVELPKGLGELRFMDVASHILPETVYVKSLNYPEVFGVLEQNYEYDLMNADKLLDKYVGKKIKIIDWNKFKDRKDAVTAILLSNNQGQIYKINDEIYLGHPGYKVLPRLPANLIANPTLVWLYQNKARKNHKLEVSYLTENINWKADYVLVLNQADTAADLSGWVTLDNRSGAIYRDARLKLVAGDVHQVEKKIKAGRFAMETMMADRGKQFKEKAFFEYHIYDLQRKTTIKNRQKKQLRLLESANIPVKKEFQVNGQGLFLTGKYRAQKYRQPVDVNITFKNNKESKLGIPLPAGVMRLYKQDHAGSLQFAGEDQIEHTPKNEDVKLKIGEAFDVVAERVQTDYKQISTGLHESAWAITLKNHKTEDIIVSIVEPLSGNWQVVKSSLPYKKIDAFTIRFDSRIPKGKTAVVTYRVRVGL